MIKLLNIILFGLMIVMNWLANALPLNNVTTGQLSDSYPNLFVPAGITFSIWGIIYILLAVFCVVQFNYKNQVLISEIGWLFAITCILNALWIITWHYRQLPLSLVVMLCLLITLIYINLATKGVPSVLIKSAFGIYLGWICIATIANVTALLVNFKLQSYGFSEATWTIIMIAAGALITSLALYRFDNPFIGFSVIWAFAGIIIKRQNDYRQIVIAAIAGIVLVAVVTAFSLIRKKVIA